MIVVDSSIWIAPRNRRDRHHDEAEALLRSHGDEAVHVSAELEDRALAWLRRHDERECSFVDATSFALMRSLKIRRAFAFDGDFTAAGFEELRPRP